MANDPTRGHYMVFPNSRITLLRRTVLDRLKKKNPRLTVVITDACGPESETTPFREGGPDAKPWKAASAVLYSLILKHVGLVDINAAQLGQFGYVNRDNPGSLFTKAFVKMCREGQFPDPENVSWKQAFDYLTKATNDLFLDLRRRRLADPDLSPGARAVWQQQTGQRPQAFYLTARLAGPANR
jgi:hypothetical protein